MKNLLKIEELAMFLLSILLFSKLNYEWWWYLALIFTPDIGMIGYIFNEKLGAITYNIFHHKGIAILVYFLGVYFSANTLILAGIILFGHSSLDRILGYGLKHITGFKHTHLGNLD